MHKSSIFIYRCGCYVAVLLTTHTHNKQTLKTNNNILVVFKFRFITFMLIKITLLVRFKDRHSGRCCSGRRHGYSEGGSSRCGKLKHTCHDVSLVFFATIIEYFNVYEQDVTTYTSFMLIGIVKDNITASIVALLKRKYMYEIAFFYLSSFKVKTNKRCNVIISLFK